MPRVVIKQDNLNSLNSQFIHEPLTQPVFLNSVPKSGTHLVRNILRMFVPVEQQYHDAFVQIPILKQNLQAFDVNNPKLSWGHLLFSDDSVIALRPAKHIVLVRDPYSWVLARTRFFLSDTFQGSLEHLKSGKVSLEEVMNMMIFGIYQKAPTLAEIFTHNAVAWLGTGVKVIKYEDVIRHLKAIDKPAAQIFFADLIGQLGYQTLPEDWQKRVKLGSDREQSGTARENLSGNIMELPDELPFEQKQLVEYAAPGLRRLLGYI
ncbi:hypothetical protein [Paraglaciecola sp.]|uniref:hypothetical protein n=1 Tax=Paraglaciecola sp. TaxID=1920173 RepID=UPI00273E4BFE|nr:hypothetical protein [Paraglaciecola sp.]MDP5032502.1 hypothetical protein [Paraglaciecola sp.]